MKLTPVVLVIISGAMLSACDMHEESAYSNCVLAQSEESYIGEKLLHDGTARNAAELTTSCIAKDVQLDAGDGATQGKVRWVVCYKGPDCNEAGMF